MSRIHEALQRAYLERGKMPNSLDIEVAEPIFTPRLEEPQQAKADLALENIAQHSWRPSTHFLSNTRGPGRRRGAVSQPSLAYLPGSL